MAEFYILLLISNGVALAAISFIAWLFLKDI